MCSSSQRGHIEQIFVCFSLLPGSLIGSVRRRAELSLLGLLGSGSDLTNSSITGALA